MTTWDWDAPGHAPPSSRIDVGQSVTGTVEAFALEANMRGDQSLTYVMDGRKRWANKQLWKTFAAARIQPGDTITITRLPDEPGSGQYPKSCWQIDRAEAPPPMQPTHLSEQQQAAGPVW
jgi:hypothetical protein